jgi:prepilin-type N-terminal cleavage/methylation domain-containing protein
LLKELNMKRHPESGFSLVELAISMSIVLVVSALATPSVITSVAAIKMTSTAQNLASLLQDARMKAARDNKTYAVSCVQYDLTTNPTTIDNCKVIFIDVNGNGDYDTSGSMSKMEIDMQVSSAVKFTTTAPSPALDNTTLGFSPNPTAASVSSVGMAFFNPRGLACKFEGPLCKNISSGGSQTGFLYYLISRDVLGNQHYGAVSVSPAGRIKVWKFNGTTWN